MKQQRADETHARILKAAGQCFATHGYDATGVAEICEAAGISKGAFYHHFAAKHDVFLELMNGWLTGLDERLESIRTGTNSIPDAFVAMSQILQELFQIDRQHLLIYLEFLNRSARDPELAGAALAPLQRYQDLFAAMVETGISEGSLPAHDPQNAARMILAMGIGLGVQGLVAPHAADWPGVSRNAMQMLFSALAQEPVLPDPEGLTFKESAP